MTSEHEESLQSNPFFVALQSNRALTTYYRRAFETPNSLICVPLAISLPNARTFTSSNFAQNHILIPAAFPLKQGCQTFLTLNGDVCVVANAAIAQDSGDILQGLYPGGGSTANGSSTQGSTPAGGEGDSSYTSTIIELYQRSSVAGYISALASGNESASWSIPAQPAATAQVLFDELCYNDDFVACHVVCTSVPITPEASEATATVQQQRKEREEMLQQELKALGLDQFQTPPERRRVSDHYQLLTHTLGTGAIEAAVIRSATWQYFEGLFSLELPLKFQFISESDSDESSSAQDAFLRNQSNLPEIAFQTESRVDKSPGLAHPQAYTFSPTGSTTKDPQSPSTLQSLARAAQRLHKAIQSAQSIVTTGLNNLSLGSSRRMVVALLNSPSSSGFSRDLKLALHTVLTARFLSKLTQSVAATNKIIATELALAHRTRALRLIPTQPCDLGLEPELLQTLERPLPLACCTPMLAAALLRARCLLRLPALLRVWKSKRQTARAHARKASLLSTQVPSVGTLPKDQSSTAITMHENPSEEELLQLALDDLPRVRMTPMVRAAIATMNPNLTNQQQAYGFPTDQDEAKPASVAANYVKFLLRPLPSSIHIGDHAAPLFGSGAIAMLRGDAEIEKAIWLSVQEARQKHASQQASSTEPLPTSNHDSAAQSSLHIKPLVHDGVPAEPETPLTTLVLLNDAMQLLHAELATRGKFEHYMSQETAKLAVVGRASLDLSLLTQQMLQNSKSRSSGQEEAEKDKLRPILRLPNGLSVTGMYDSYAVSKRKLRARRASTTQHTAASERPRSPSPPLPPIVSKLPKSQTEASSAPQPTVIHYHLIKETGTIEQLSVPSSEFEAAPQSQTRTSSAGTGPKLVSRTRMRFVVNSGLFPRTSAVRAGLASVPIGKALRELEYDSSADSASPSTGSGGVAAASPVAAAAAAALGFGAASGGFETAEQRNARASREAIARIQQIGVKGGETELRDASTWLRLPRGHAAGLAYFSPQQTLPQADHRGIPAQGPNLRRASTSSIPTVSSGQHLLMRTGTQPLLKPPAVQHGSLRNVAPVAASSSSLVQPHGRPVNPVEDPDGTTRDQATLQSDKTATPGTVISTVPESTTRQETSEAPQISEAAATHERSSPSTNVSQTQPQRQVRHIHFLLNPPKVEDDLDIVSTLVPQTPTPGEGPRQWEAQQTNGAAVDRGAGTRELLANPYRYEYEPINATWRGWLNLDFNPSNTRRDGNQPKRWHRGCALPHPHSYSGRVFLPKADLADLFGASLDQVEDDWDNGNYTEGDDDAEVLEKLRLRQAGSGNDQPSGPAHARDKSTSGEYRRWTAETNVDAVSAIRELCLQHLASSRARSGSRPLDNGRSQHGPENSLQPGRMPAGSAIYALAARSPAEIADAVERMPPVYGEDGSLLEKSLAMAIVELVTNPILVSLLQLLTEEVGISLTDVLRRHAPHSSLLPDRSELDESGPSPQGAEARQMNAEKPFTTKRYIRWGEQGWYWMPLEINLNSLYHCVAQLGWRLGLGSTFDTSPQQIYAKFVAQPLSWLPTMPEGLDTDGSVRPSHTALTADDQIPIVAYLLIQANPSKLATRLALAEHLSPPPSLLPSRCSGFWNTLTHFRAAIEFLLTNPCKLFPPGQRNNPANQSPQSPQANSARSAATALQSLLVPTQSTSFLDWGDEARRAVSQNFGFTMEDMEAPLQQASVSSTQTSDGLEVTRLQGAAVETDSEPTRVEKKRKDAMKTAQLSLGLIDESRKEDDLFGSTDDSIFCSGEVVIPRQSVKPDIELSSDKHSALDHAVGKLSASHLQRSISVSSNVESESPAGTPLSASSASSGPPRGRTRRPHPIDSFLPTLTPSHMSEQASGSLANQSRTTSSNTHPDDTKTKGHHSNQKSISVRAGDDPLLAMLASSRKPMQIPSDDED